MTPAEAGPRRRIPSVDALLRSEPGRRAAATFGRALVKRCIADVLEAARAAAERGRTPADADTLLATAIAAAARAAGGPITVINATGVILHTGLGRASLPDDAVDALARAARSYTDLEIDLDSGGRGRRTARAETMLRALTGAEDALVVNNGAAALLLALAAIGGGRQVVVSRGELVEIGGGFRIPDILRASGAKLVEVGTTNRTRVGDFREAIGERTALLLKVHPSNYRIVGFAAAPTAAQLGSLARSTGVPFVYDLGSGLLDLEDGALAEEPSVVDALADGADLALFSGDKLLGGSQAGVVVGRADLVARLRKHPTARAVRVDKLQIAALESVLATILAGGRDTLPVWSRLREPLPAVRVRARTIAAGLGDGATVVDRKSTRLNSSHVSESRMPSSA